MPKTIRELAAELKVSKQTIHHYQRLPTNNRQKDSQGTNMISLTAERIIRDKVAKKGQRLSEAAKTFLTQLATDLQQQIPTD